ncbi:MAG: HEAT repeat domain-containing protein [Chitinophagales bacterium]
MNTALLRLLNIKPSEAWLVRNLFFLQLFQSIGIAMLLTLSNALFLAEFNVDELPKVYMISGVILLVVNYVYAKLEHKLPIQRLILYILITSAVSILIIRILIYSVEYRYAPVVLLIWYQVIYLLCSNSFWGLASQVFDVRESKRTFSILSAGDTPAKLLGYLSISAFAGTLGISNFLFISVLCFIISYLFMLWIIRTKKVDFKKIAHHVVHKETIHAVKTPGPIEVVKSFFGNNLILLISILSFIVVASLNVIDFTFLSDVKLQFHDDVALLTFLGQFLAAGRVFAILAKITLTSRIERQLGIKKSLLILPVLLIGFTIFVLVSKRLEGNVTFYLYAFGSMVVITEVLKSVLQDPLLLVLFQPLTPLLRLKGHLISKGILAPLGLLAAGAFIFTSIQLSGSLNITTTCYLLLLMCAAWIVVVYLLDRQYINTLIESLKTGFFRGNFLLSNDSAVKQLLFEKMKSKRPLEVIYAADTLEKLDKSALNEIVSVLLHHEEEAVKKFALKKAYESRIVSVIPIVQSLLNEEVSDDLRIECLITLSGLHEDQTDFLLNYLDHPNIQLQQQAMIALLTSGDINSIIVAGTKLMGWMNHKEEQFRILAAATIGKAADKNFYNSLSKLLNDPSPAVQKRAIEAAGEIKSNRLIPLIFEKLEDPATTSTAIGALVSCGDEVFRFFPSTEQLLQTSLKSVQRYIKIAERIPGVKAGTFLESILLTDTRVKTMVITAMKEMSYAAPPHMTGNIQKLIDAELDAAGGIISYLSVLGKGAEFDLLCNALITELKTCESNIFHLLSFIFDRAKLLRAFEHLRSGRKETFANAIEIIDLGVTKKIGSKFIPVIEYLHLQQEAVESTSANAGEILSLIKKIIANSPVLLSSWTNAAAIYVMNQINHAESVSYLSTFETNGDYLVEETRNFVLAK